MKQERIVSDTAQALIDANDNTQTFYVSYNNETRIIGTSLEELNQLRVSQ